MSDQLSYGTLARIEKLLERIVAAVEQPAFIVPPTPINVDVLDNFRARCPGCGNIKGRRHNQGCPHIVRAPHRRLKP